MSGRGKDEPDFEDAIACYQLKHRESYPKRIAEWLSGICAVGAGKQKAGVLILSKPGKGMRSEDALVVLTWRAWRDLHGVPETEVTGE